MPGNRCGTFDFDPTPFAHQIPCLSNHRRLLFIPQDQPAAFILSSQTFEKPITQDEEYVAFLQMFTRTELPKKIIRDAFIPLTTKIAPSAPTRAQLGWW
jgi:hypothetical protein